MIDPTRLAHDIDTRTAAVVRAIRKLPPGKRGCIESVAVPFPLAGATGMVTIKPCAWGAVAGERGEVWEEETPPSPDPSIDGEGFVRAW